MESEIEKRGKNFEHWVEKHRAKTFSDLKGHEKAVAELQNFFSNFPHKKKAILLHGPAGTGKTTLAYIARNEFNLEVFELNASDFRNKEQLHLKLRPALEQRSLFKKGKVILVDEVDGLSSSDRGGLPELLELIEGAQFPMVITANNIWDGKFGELRKRCLMVAMNDLNYKVISIILQEIAKKEGLEIDNHVLTSIAVRSKGDVRAAINDLQTISKDSDFFEATFDLSERNRSIDIFEALKFVFKNLSNPEILRIYDGVDIPLEKIFLWIEENIPYEYSGEELFKAYEALSSADVFRGRIRRQRHWRFLVYQNIFLSAGIALAKKKPKTGFTHYQRPTRILKIWTYNQRNVHKKSIIAKYARHAHMSKRKANTEFPFIKNILKEEKMHKLLDLSDKEIKYLKELKS